MNNPFQFKNANFLYEQKLQLLVYYLSNSTSDSLIAYCINNALKNNDYDGIVALLKGVQQDGEYVISDIYGEMVLSLVKSL